MRLLLPILMLSVSIPTAAQLSFPLEKLVNKDTASAEFREMAKLSGMEELTAWARDINGKPQDRYFAFKAESFHGRIKIVRKDKIMLVEELTVYKPGKGSPKIKSKTLRDEIPLKFSWDMSEMDIKAKLGSHTQNWVRYQGYEIQCNGFTERADYKLNTVIIRQAIQYKPNTYIDPVAQDPIPPLMARVIQEAMQKGCRLDRKETLPFQPNVGQMSSTKEIKFIIPASAKFYMLYINLEHTIGGNVYINDEKGNFIPCDLMPVNADFLIYAPETFKTDASGKTFTIHLASNNTSVHSKVSVYYFREQ